MVLGAEYDGTVLRLVRMHDRRVTQYQTFSATITEASALIRSEMDRQTKCVMAWGSPGASVRRSSVPRVPARQLLVAARELVNRQLPGGADRPGAGMVVSGGNTATPSAAVGAITADVASDLRNELDSTRCSLVVAPFTLEHDGLYLAIRNSGVELILVAAGIAVASRHLRCGGLANALRSDQLAEDLESNALEVVAAGDLNNADAVAAARRYVATLVREVRRTTDHWEASGEACPSTIWVYGPGATLPHLPSYMSSIGLNAQAPPVAHDLELGAIPTPQRLAAYGALSAAVAAAGPQRMLDLSRAKAPRGVRAKDLNTGDPFAGFEGVINASGTRGFSTPRTNYQRPEPLPRGTGLAFVGTVIAVALAVAGWWMSANALGDASRALAAAQRVSESRQAEAAYATEVGIVAERLSEVEITEPTEWSAAIRPLLIYLPAFPVAESIRVSEIGDTLEARILTATDLTDVDDWTEALSLAGTVVAVTVLTDTSVFTPGSTVTEFIVQIFSPVPDIVEAGNTNRAGDSR
jgi:hypothetical protein